MRIERIHVGGFGRLRALDTGEEPLGGLVVVLGPNEAGKSTLFHFLTSMLYGFYPATRDGNAYAPWDGSEPSGSVDIRLSDGSCVQIERRLLSTPAGRMSRDGKTEDIRNRTIPWAEHVPRAVFRQVFALTLGELAGLDQETWARIQDHIVGSMGATDLVPARSVVADLEQEAGELWRPNRRGNQRVRTVQEEILSLRDRRREALENDRVLRGWVAELHEVRADLQKTREERHAEQAILERVQALAPIRGQLRRIEGLREDAGSTEVLDGFPADPEAELDERRRRVEKLARQLDELRKDRAEPEAEAARFGDAEALLLERREDIVSFLGAVAGLAGDRARLAALDQESRDLTRRIDDAATQVFSEPFESTLEGPLARVSTGELREQVRRFASARDRRRLAEAVERGGTTDARSAGLPPAWGAALLLPGVALLSFGLARQHLIATALGTAITTVGLFLLVGGLIARGTPSRAENAGGGPTSDIARADREEEVAARAAIEAHLEALPTRASLLSEPSEILASGIERLQDLVRDRRERSARSEELRERLSDADEAARDIGRLAGLSAELGAEAVAQALDVRLRRAEGLNEAAAAAKRELGRLDREKERLVEELEHQRAELKDLVDRVRAMGDGELDRGIQTIRDRLHARARADQLLDELERTHPDLDEIRTRIEQAEASGDSWTVDDADLARRRARVEELNEETVRLTGRSEALDSEIAHLREGETADAIDGEIASLREQEAALLRERDRKWILARLVNQADRRFREVHQPDVMRRAGGYLARLTDGRYGRISAEEASSGERFHLVGPDLPGPVPLEAPISTGTLEQAYLALRFAIVDHLDRGQERLPLFVDEVFVNWDDARRTQGIRLLADVSEDRQLFVFTCHPGVADELGALGARVLTLTREG